VSLASSSQSVPAHHRAAGSPARLRRDPETPRLRSGDRSPAVHHRASGGPKSAAAQKPTASWRDQEAFCLQVVAGARNLEYGATNGVPAAEGLDVAYPPSSQPVAVRFRPSPSAYESLTRPGSAFIGDSHTVCLALGSSLYARLRGRRPPRAFAPYGSCVRA
jgi:hypothetical protein